MTSGYSRDSAGMQWHSQRCHVPGDKLNIHTRLKGSEHLAKVGRVICLVQQAWWQRAEVGFEHEVDELCKTRIPLLIEMTLLVCPGSCQYAANLRPRLITGYARVLCCIKAPCSVICKGTGSG